MFAGLDTASMGDVMSNYLGQALMLAAFVAGVFAAPPQQARSPSADVLMGSGIHQQDVEADFAAAIALYQKVVEHPGARRALVAMALLRIGQCYEKLGDIEARKTYGRLVREYTDQHQVVEQAQKRLAVLTDNAGTLADGSVVQRLVWTGDNYWSGLPSPDARYLPWADAPKLMLRDLITGTDRTVDAGDGAVFGNGVFAPDGHRLIYGWFEPVTWNYLLKVVDLRDRTGSAGRVFHKTDYYRADFDSQLYDPELGAVSPDGRWLAVSAGHQRSTVLALIDITSGDHRVLKEFPSPGIRDIRAGNFSADGRYLVYAIRPHADSPETEIRSIALDNTSEVTLVAAPGVNVDPMFTPDGSEVVFTSNRSGLRWDLWSIRVRDGKASDAPVLVKADIGRVTNLGFTRDGAFYFRAATVLEDALTVQIDPARGTVTGPPQRVSRRYVNSTFAPRWSPDGRQLAYVVNAGKTGIGYREVGEVRFVVRDVESGEEREFPAPFRFNPGLFPRAYRWFPDNRSLLLMEWDNRGAYFRRTFRRLDLQTGRIGVVAEVQASNQMCGTAISPDGRALFYTRRDDSGMIDPSLKPGDRRTFWLRRDLATGEEVEVARLDGGWVAPSSDGSDLLYFKQWSSEWFEIIPWIRSVKDGAERPIPRPSERGFQYQNCIEWNARDNGIFMALSRGPYSRSFFNSKRSEPHELWFFPLDGNGPRFTGISMQHLQSLTLSPDGRQLGFTGGSSFAQVWSLKNLFPRSSGGASRQ
jgi:Tol biopolymer transport system component